MTEVRTPEPREASGTVDSALGYAAMGWPVFPCHPGTKVPLTGHGYVDASTDPQVITAWWSRCPNANIGIATGAPAPDVVDVDTKDGAPGLATRDRLARAGLLRGAFAEVRTPSGGQHYYYPGTAQRNGARKRHGIDFRSTGGYVVAPPSQVDGRAYVLLDSLPMTEGAPVDWARITTFLDPPPPRIVYTPARVARQAPRRLARLLAEPVEVGQRSERFHALAGLCRSAGMGVDEAVALLEPWCEETGKYVNRVDQELYRSWRNMGEQG